MIALIPIAIGQTIDHRVFEGIRNQTIPLSPIICAAKGVIDSQGNYCLERVRGEVQSRDLQVQNAKHLKGEYILSIDRDIVLTDRHAVQAMVECLQENQELGAVGLWFERGRKITVWLPHIYFKCILFRREVFSKIDFTKHDVRSCSCYTVKQQIEGMGLKIRYLDFERRGVEMLL